GQHADDGAEIGARQLAVGPRPATQRKERLLLPFLCGDLGDDLLRDDIEWPLGDRDAVEFAALDALQERRAFDEFVARLREEPALRCAVNGVARAPDPLEKGR